MRLTNPFHLILYLCFLSIGFVQAQQWDQKEIEEAALGILPEALAELNEVLKIPNNGHFPEQMEANARWCMEAFRKRGFTVELLRENQVPFVLAKQIVDPDLPIVLFYLQMDGQPVDPREWDQPDPYIPIMKKRTDQDEWEAIGPLEWRPELSEDTRIFARSASDSKGPAICFIKALDILQNAGLTIPYNVKVIMDFQEEMSSPQLPVLVRNQTEKLAANRLVVMDGTRHVSNLPTLTYGARGIATASLRIFGPKQAMHSGQYGNYVPNPVFAAAKLIAKLKDDEGKVLIPGYYDGIQLSDEEKEILKRVPENEADMLASIGIARPESVAPNYQESLQYPTLNIKGIQAAWVGGKSRTIIPEEVVISMDARLVPESDGKKLMQSIRQFIVDAGFHLVNDEPTADERKQYSKLAAFRYKVSYEAYRTPFNSPIGPWCTKALTRAFGRAPVQMRTTGGSQPIAPFIQALGLPALSVRIPNPDNNIHAPNENLRLGNFIEGIRSCVAILTEPL